MSATVVLFPIIAALLSFTTTFTDQNQAQTWHAAHKTQQEFIERYWPCQNELSNFASHEMKIKASYNVDEVNTFLKDNKFTIQLQPFPDSVYVAAIMDILLKWAVPGSETMIMSNEKQYPAVIMKTRTSRSNGKDGFRVFADAGTNQPVVEVAAENGDSVYMMLADKPLDGFALLDRIKEVAITREPEHVLAYDELVFPMVNIDEQPDISWLLKMEWRGDPVIWCVSQALQQTRFQMNETGAAAQSAVAVRMTKECCRIPKIYMIDKPFYLWIMRPGMTIPLFAAYIDESLWQKPAKLGK